MPLTPVEVWNGPKFEDEDAEEQTKRLRKRRQIRLLWPELGEALDQKEKDGQKV